MAQGIGLQSAINQTLGTIQTGVVQNIAIKQLREQTATSKKQAEQSELYARKLHEISTNDRSNIDENLAGKLPVDKILEIQKAYKVQQTKDKLLKASEATIRRNLELQQRQTEQSNRKLGKDTLMEVLYGKKQSETT